MSVFGSDDEQAIATAVERAESQTAAELVVLLVPRSGEYTAGRALVAGAGAVVVMTLLDWAWPWIAQAMPALADVLPLDPLAWLLPLQVVVAGALWWATARLPARWFTSDARMAEAVERRAKQAFFDRRVSHTRDRSGVLLLVSEAERRVQILADRGVDEALAADVWSGWVDRVIAGMQAGQGAQALCSVIEHMGQTLAEPYPVRDDDEDELPNAPAREA